MLKNLVLSYQAYPVRFSWTFSRLSFKLVTKNKCTMFLENLAFQYCNYELKAIPICSFQSEASSNNFFFTEL